MMKKLPQSPLVLLALVVLGSNLTLSATVVSDGVIPGRWEKVDALARGTELKVVLKPGEEIDGTLLASDSESLSLQRRGGTTLQIRKADVEKVSGRKKVTDSVADGLLFGSVVGAFVGLPCVVLSLSDGGPNWIAAGILGFSAGVGAGVGVTADALHRAQEVLYRSR